MNTCFRTARILLPGAEVNMSKWAVVACDQYTSQPEYWRKAESFVGDEPSTLRLILPEAFLENGKEKIPEIHRTMKEYLRRGTVIPAVEDGFILVERETESGIRLGLIGALDLESYDYRPQANALVRATEKTVVERIPARMTIREGAAMELPHAMVLVDDPGKKLVEEVYARKNVLRLLYDTQLMLGGGHIRGYALEGNTARYLQEKIAAAQEESDGFFLAVGDGNHSLAAAKACWEKKKKNLSLEQRENDPARFALVELVNLHSDALKFEPVHRILFYTSLEALTGAFEKWLSSRNIPYQEGEELLFFQGEKRRGYTPEGLPVAVLQTFLDAYLQDHPDVSIDYIHGEDAVEELVKSMDGCGILLKPMEKRDLFPAIRAGGILPRKTFSMGNAWEKRYYLECREIFS